MINSNYYHYIKNILGDILGLVDENGGYVADYTYDAWGNILSATASIDNSLRYKGYYYDSETDMYYCHTRYYVPKWLRWLNSDNIEYLDMDDFTGINLFCYCGNNPVISSDPDGNMAKWARWVIGGALIIGAIALTVATAGAASVAIAGALGLSGIAGSIVGGAIAGAVLGAVSGAMISVGTQVIADGTVDIAQVGKDALFGAISGAVMGGAFGALKYCTGSYDLFAKSASGFNKAQANLTSAEKAMENTGKAYRTINSSHNLTEYIGSSLKYASANSEFAVADSMRGLLQTTFKNGAEFANFGLSSGLQELIERLF